MIEIIDILILIIYISLLSICLLILILKKNMFTWSFIVLCIATAIVIVLEFILSDIQSAAIWIQAGATLLLVFITLAYAIANQNLVDISQKQLIYAEKDRKSKIIKDIAQNVFIPLKKDLEETKSVLKNGNIFTRLILNNNYTEEKKFPVWFSPKRYLDKQVHYPDEVLMKYLEKINQLSDEYDTYAERIEKLFNENLSKILLVGPDFRNLCIYLNGGQALLNETDYEDLFVYTLADATINEKYPQYLFFTKNKLELRAKLIGTSLHDAMEEYLKIRVSFIEFLLRYEGLIGNLLNEWKREYYLTEREMTGVSGY